MCPHVAAGLPRDTGKHVPRLRVVHRLITMCVVVFTGRRCGRGRGFTAEADKDLGRGNAEPVLNADAWPDPCWLHDASDAGGHGHGTWADGPSCRGSCDARDGHATDAARSAAGGHVHGSYAAQSRHVSIPGIAAYSSRFQHRSWRPSCTIACLT